uniref:Uncharacterized protein n=1 Tax=Hucho hucho TaxID=62062 RepID=A0A4W5NHU6_9TELE
MTPCRAYTQSLQIFLTTHLKNVSRMDSLGSLFHCHPLHNQNRMTSSPCLHSWTHSPSISSMAALSWFHSPGMAAPSLATAQFNMWYHSFPPEGTASCPLQRVCAGPRDEAQGA